MIEIKNHRAVVDGKPADWKKSPNISGTIVPEQIVLHDTASGLKPDGDISWLTDPASKVSAHVVIARDGKITQLADFNARCWHAGQSKWEGKANVNGFAIGIEIDNPGRLRQIAPGVYSGVATFNSLDPSIQVAEASTPQHGSGWWMAYTDAQIQAVIELCRALIERYPTIKGIITHWLISPGRKVDTNPLFPLEQVRNKVFGAKDVPEPPPPSPAVAARKLTFISDASVIASSLNLRATPNGKILGTLARGARLDVIEMDRLTGWTQVVTAKDKTGYVFSKFIKLDVP